jgi:hypothetical protein
MDWRPYSGSMLRLKTARRYPSSQGHDLGGALFAEKGAERMPGAQIVSPLGDMGPATLPGTDELTRRVQRALVAAMVCIMQTAAVAGTFLSDEGRPDNGAATSPGSARAAS